MQGNPTNANLGDAAGALQSYRTALALAEAASRGSAADPQARRFIGVVLEKVADVQGATGDAAEAAETARQSLAIFEEVANATGTDDAKLSLAISRIKVGDVLGNPNTPNIGDRDGAMQSYRASAELLEELHARKPADQKVRRSFGLIHERMGDVMNAAGNMHEALDAYERAFAMRVPLARENPANFEIVRDEAVAHERLAGVEAASGNFDAALEHRRRSLEILARLASADPQNAAARQSLAISHIHLGELVTDVRNAADQNVDEAVREFSHGRRHPLFIAQG